MDALTEHERNLRARYPARVVRRWSRTQGWPTGTRGNLHIGLYECFHAWTAAAILRQEVIVGQIQRAHR